MEELVVLVVEDESLLGILIEDALHEGGFASRYVPSGENAIELLMADARRYCALVTDINLGQNRIRGWEVARRARELNPEIPVIYVTGDSGNEWASHGMPNSVLINKPFALTQIHAAIVRLLNYPSPED